MCMLWLQCCTAYVYCCRAPSRLAMPPPVPCVQQEMPAPPLTSPYQYHALRGAMPRRDKRWAHRHCTHTHTHTNTHTTHTHARTHTPHIHTYMHLHSLTCMHIHFFWSHHYCIISGCATLICSYICVSSLATHVFKVVQLNVQAHLGHYYIHT